MYRIIESNNLNKLPLQVDAWKLVNENNIEIINIILKPNQFIEQHSNEFDIYFFMLSGSVSFKINNEEVNLQQNKILFIEKNVLRSCSNNHTQDSSLLVIKLKN